MYAAGMKKMSWLNLVRYITGNLIVIFVTTNIAQHAGMDLLGAISMGLLMTVGLNNMDALVEMKMDKG